MKKHQFYYRDFCLPLHYSHGFRADRFTCLRIRGMAGAPYAFGRCALVSGQKEAAGPHVLIGMLLFGIGLHFFAKPELSWWPGDFEMILFVFGFSLFAATRKEYVYEAVAMIGFSSFYTSLNKLRRGWSPSIFRRNTSKHTGRMFSSESAFYYCLSSGTKLYDKTQNALRFGFFITG